jgi:hypothetical protein
MEKPTEKDEERGLSDNVNEMERLRKDFHFCLPPLMFISHWIMVAQTGCKIYKRRGVWTLTCLH